MRSKSSSSRAALCAAVGMAAVGIAIACGAEFPTTLLHTRADVLTKLAPMDWLSTEIEELVPPATDALQASEGGRDVAIIERQDIEDTRMVHLAAMRASKSGSAAYDAGKALPQAIRLYVAGAVEFNAGLGAALSYFTRVLELPPSERSPRATWAAFMAGRVLAADPQQLKQASRYFQLTRELARKGMPDPMGLAVGSYGEEARLHLNRGAITQALELYLEQAARGSNSARNSLRIVAQRLLDDPDLAIKHIRDPRIQRLWSAAALAEGQDGPNVDRPEDAESGASEAELESNAESEPEGKPERPKESWSSRVERVTAAINEANGARFDQLSALAYQTGRFDLAATLATRSDTAIAMLVRAKLALRDNKRELAAQEFSRAVGARAQARRVGDHRLSDSAWSRLVAESGVLAVSRSDYGVALESFIEAGPSYWMDAAYIAERVLTSEELAAFAERHPIRPRPPALELGAREEGKETEQSAGFGAPTDPREALQLLLGRRQMREQRYDQALASFKQTSAVVFEAEKPVSELAQSYVVGIRQGADRWTQVGKAESLMAAAKIAQQFGMEVLGYELAPDFSVFQGDFELDPIETVHDFVSDDELSRTKASEPQARRFHYRGVAVDLALRAADLLPPRSQAFAAVLCRSLQWAKSSRDDERARSIYERYVREAAFVSWSEKFGVHCEEPDFDRAAEFVWRQRLSLARATLRPYKTLFVVGGAVVIAAVAALALRRGCSSASPP